MSDIQDIKLGLQALDTERHDLGRWLMDNFPVDTSGEAQDG